MRPFGASSTSAGPMGCCTSAKSTGDRSTTRDVLEVGEMIEVEVIRVDPENQRIALSRKRRLPNPWDTVEQRYHPGEIVPVKIRAWSTSAPLPSWSRAWKG